jgi:hypothetical protein
MTARVRRMGFAPQVSRRRRMERTTRKTTRPIGTNSMARLKNRSTAVGTASRSNMSANHGHDVPSGPL